LFKFLRKVNSMFHVHAYQCQVVFVLQEIKPTILIGSSGVGRTFTKEVIEAMSTFNEVLRPPQSLVSPPPKKGKQKDSQNRSLVKHLVEKTCA